MNINELPAFLKEYSRRVHTERQDYRNHTVSISSSAYPLSFCLCYTTEYDSEEKSIHAAATLELLLEKMKKDIDGTP